MKLEQSSIREVTSGMLPVRVPVTALAQSLALQAEITPCAMVKATVVTDTIFIVRDLMYSNLNRWALFEGRLAKLLNKRWQV
jgi:hypothetical protein